MARPAILRLENGGEITFRNIPIDQVNKLKDLIQGKNEKITLPNKALSIVQDPNTQMWDVYVLEFSAVTKEAKVVDVIRGGEYHGMAKEIFITLAYKHNII